MMNPRPTGTTTGTCLLGQYMMPNISAKFSFQILKSAISQLKNSALKWYAESTQPSACQIMSHMLTALSAVRTR